MARRRKAAKRGARNGRLPLPLPRRWALRLALAANLAVLAAGGVWYALQPPTRQDEVRLLVGNALQRQKRIRLWEVAWDLYTLYYADVYVPSSFSGRGAAAYAGEPQAEAPGPTVRILANDAFTVGYCEAWRSPLWVAYRLVDVPADAAPERPDGFAVDGRSLARVRPEDYAGSGFDRGHLAPSYGIGRCYGAAAQRETFLMTNIVPQEHELNVGAWRDLERREALNYTGRFREIWVITGPLFLGGDRQLDAGVRVPEAFYKIQVDEHEGGIRMQAFIFRQKADPGERLSVFLTTVDEIERLAGLNFFPALEDEAEARLEAQAPTRAW